MDVLNTLIWELETSQYDIDIISQLVHKHITRPLS